MFIKLNLIYKAIAGANDASVLTSNTSARFCFLARAGAAAFVSAPSVVLAARLVFWGLSLAAGSSNAVSADPALEDSVFAAPVLENAVAGASVIAGTAALLPQSIVTSTPMLDENATISSVVRIVDTVLQFKISDVNQVDLDDTNHTSSSAETPLHPDRYPDKKIAASLDREIEVGMRTKFRGSFTRPSLNGKGTTTGTALECKM